MASAVLFYVVCDAMFKSEKSSHACMKEKQRETKSLYKTKYCKERYSPGSWALRRRDLNGEENTRDDEKYGV